MSDATSEQGYRAEVRVPGPDDCPIAAATDGSDAASLGVSKAINPGEGGDPVVTEEVMFDGEPAETEELEYALSYGESPVYRFDREFDRDCACVAVESFDCPIVDVRANEGHLDVTFHARDRETLRDAIEALERQYDEVDVKRLLRTGEERESEDLVFVDRSVLTDRQAEVLTTAHELGYFDHPKGANGSEVAEALDISPSTFAEHLARAQDKLLTAILD